MPNKNSQNVINCIRKRKLDLISVLGNRCCLCGFDLYPEALDFHHVNPEDKEYGIGSSNAATKALSKQLQELKKCVLVCANCHRGIHGGHLKVPTEWPTFYNETLAKQLLQKLEDIKSHKINYCKRCGKEIYRTSEHCEECSSILQRKIDRPSKEELKQLIRTLPFTQIAQKYKVTDNAIRKWCIAYNLPSKKMDIKNYTEKEWELL